jgi:hypothetical protein
MRNIPILPIGPVNLKTGKNHMIAPLEDWSPGAFVVVQDANLTFRGISGSSSVEWMQKQFPISSSVPLCHDQTRKRIGQDGHLVKSHHAMTQAGFDQVRALYGITALQMATLK